MRKSINKIGLFALAGVLCTGVVATSATAEEEKPTADLSVSLLSKYVWRGFELSKDSMVIQPSLTVGYKGFGVNVWGNLDTDEHDDTLSGHQDTDSSSWNETDFTLSYDGSAGMVDYGVGWIYYAVDDNQDTQEVYVSASLQTILAPTLTVYRDYDVYDSWYITFGISHSIPLGENLALDLGAQAGYYDIDDADYNEFHDGLLSASMTFPIGEYFSVTPEIYYSFPLSSDSEDALEASSFNNDDSDFIYGGITLGMSF